MAHRASEIQCPAFHRRRFVPYFTIVTQGRALPYEAASTPPPETVLAIQDADLEYNRTIQQTESSSGRPSSTIFPTLYMVLAFMGVPTPL
jgi:hypothetical protein